MAIFPELIGQGVLNIRRQMANAFPTLEVFQRQQRTFESLAASIFERPLLPNLCYFGRLSDEMRKILTPSIFQKEFLRALGLVEQEDLNRMVANIPRLPRYEPPRRYVSAHKAFDSTHRPLEPEFHDDPTPPTRRLIGFDRESE